MQRKSEEQAEVEAEAQAEAAVEAVAWSEAGERVRGCCKDRDCV